MTSAIDITTIDETKPIYGSATTASVRDNTLAIKNALATAKTEIEAAQAADVALVSDLKGGVTSAGDTLKKLYDLIVGVGQLVGDFDASGGALPAVGTGLLGVIDKGDSWHITVAGILPIGLTPTVNVKAGDMLVARIADASVGADFYVIENTVAQATSSILGILKLYTDLSASNTDGAVTQAAIVTALAAIFTTANSWTKAQHVTPVSLSSSGGSVAVDLSLSNNFSHTLTENTALANPSNIVAGQSGQITFIQHASAAKTLAFGSDWHSADGAAQALSTTVGAINLLTYYVNSSTHITYSLIKHGVA